MSVICFFSRLWLSMTSRNGLWLEILFQSVVLLKNPLFMENNPSRPILTWKTKSTSKLYLQGGQASLDQNSKSIYQSRSILGSRSILESKSIMGSKSIKIHFWISNFGSKFILNQDPLWIKIQFGIKIHFGSKSILDQILLWSKIHFLIKILFWIKSHF